MLRQDCRICRVNFSVPVEIGRGEVELTQLGEGVSYGSWTCDDAQEETSMDTELLEIAALRLAQLGDEHDAGRHLRLMRSEIDRLEQARPTAAVRTSPGLNNTPTWLRLLQERRRTARSQPEPYS